MSTPSTTPGTSSAAAAPAVGHALMPDGAPGGRFGALGPVGLVLAGGISVQFGAALAVSLMPRAGALGVVTLRLAVAAVVMLLVCGPGCAATPGPTGARSSSSASPWPA